MASDPHVSTLLWIGLGVTFVVGLAALIPMWAQAHQRWKKDNSTNLLTPYLLPFLLTIALMTGIHLITMGGIKTAASVDFHNAKASKPRQEFIQQVKEDDAAVVPVSRKTLQEKYQTEEAEAKAQEKTEAEKFEEFRHQMGVTEEEETK